MISKHNPKDAEAPPSRYGSEVFFVIVPLPAAVDGGVGGVQHVKPIKTSVCVLILFPFATFGKTLNLQKQTVFYSLLLLIFIPERIYPANRSFHKST